MEVMDVCEALIARKLCKSQAHFCRDWLERTKAYLHVTKGTASPESTLVLWRNLQAAQQVDLSAIIFGRLAARPPRKAK